MKVGIVGNLANVGLNLLNFLRRKQVRCDLLVSSAEFDRIDQSIKERHFNHIHLIEINAALRRWQEFKKPQRGITKRSNSDFTEIDIRTGQNKVQVLKSWIGQQIVTLFEQHPEFREMIRRQYKKFVYKNSIFYNYDVLISMSSGNQLPAFIDIPFIAIATGSDLREESYKPKISKGYEEGFRKSKIVLSWMFDDRATNKVKMFRLSQFRLFHYPVDTEVFFPQKVILKERNQYDFILFNPTRLDWSYRGKKRWPNEPGGQKANDRLIKAFAQIVKSKEKLSIQNPLLILVKGKLDVDSQKTQTLICEMNIEKHVVIKDYLSFDERIKYINGSDVIADHFNTGSFGGTFIEVLSCGKPLIHYVNPKNIYLSYEDFPPILNAHTEEEIYERLVEALDIDKRVELGIKARQWIMKYHHWEKTINKLIHYLQLVYGKSDVYDIEDGYEK